MIEAAVEKGIRDIEENAGRGIRNLVDLGTHFATGRFQKEFFSYAEGVLKDRDSGYYRLTNHLVKYVDHTILKRFGINLGYNSWTYGADKIRENERNLGYNIPWSIIFDFRKPAEQVLSIAEISDILQNAETFGIYCGMFFINRDKAFVEDLAEALAKHRDSAYILFLNSKMITEEIADAVVKASNIVIAIRMDTADRDPGCGRASGILLDKKCLYGAYSIYNDNNIGYVMSEEYNGNLEELQCSFSFLVKGEKSSEQNSEALAQFIKESQQINEYPFFMMDFYRDLAHIDRVISVEDCFLAIAADGKISTENMDHPSGDLSIRDVSLPSILDKTMPRTRYV